MGSLLNRKRKYTWSDITLKLILLFPITTLLQRFMAFNHLNKILICVLAILLLFSNRKLSYKSVFLVIFLTFLFVMTLFYTEFDIQYINEYFYLPIWVLYYIYFKNNFAHILHLLYKNIAFIRTVIMLWMLVATGYLLVILTHQPLSNDSIYTDHRAAATCLFVLILIWIYIALTGRKRILLFGAIPILYTLMMSARTYLVVNTIVLTCIYYYCCNKKRWFYLTLIPWALIFIYIVTLTPMMTKIQSSLQKNLVYDFWGMLTSGRTVFFKIDMDAYFNLSFWNQMVGNGITYVHQVNKDLYGVDLWAHNDFINILLSNGLGGLILYLIVFIDFCKTSFMECGSIFYLFFFLMACFMNAMLNGLYLYTCAMLAMPFMMTAGIFSIKNGCVFR